MDKTITYDVCSAWQEKMYNRLNHFSRDHSILGRLGTIPVAIGDTILETLSIPVIMIEHVAKTALHLLFAFFSENYTFKGAIENAELALQAAGAIPGRILVAPFKLVHQILAGLIDPVNVQSFVQEGTYRRMSLT